MKKHLIMCAAALLMLSFGNNSFAAEKTYNKGINIIPNPESLVQKEGSFTMNKTTKFAVLSPEAKTVATFFSARIARATGYNLAITSKNAANCISLVIDKTLDVNDEGYTLDVTAKSVSIKAKTAQGLFYGMESFMQLLPAEIESPKLVANMLWKASCVTIKDQPRFGYRGMMIDPCRHFMTVSDIKKQLDVMALFKINRLHWHLTEDQGWRIEIKKYPKLTEIGSKRIEGDGTVHSGFYTQEQIKDVVKYAADRYITIVPEIELPGHELAAIASYPELSCNGKQISPRIIWGVEDVVMCAGKEETFKFLEDVISEVVKLFPGEYFHIGGDECPKTSWKNCPLCQQRIKDEGLEAKDGHSAEERLQSYFVQRIEKVLTKYGKKMIGWDEILEGGLAPSATVMSWRGETGGIAAANQNHDVIMTPGSGGLYLDHYQGDYKIEPVGIGGYSTIEKTYSYDPVPKSLVEAGKAQFIKGVQCNVWAEYLYGINVREYRTYPRLVALSEIAWSPLDRKDFKDFTRRLENASVRLDEHKIHYYIPQPEQPNGSCNFVAFTDKASLAFKTTRPIKMVYTTNGVNPTPNSTAYSQPIEFTKTGVLKIRSVLSSGVMTPVRTIKVEKQTLAPAKNVANVQPGLNMKVTDGTFFDASKLAAVKDWNTMVIDSLLQITSYRHSNEDMRDFKQYSAIVSGYVDIPEDGVWYISSDNEEVWIDGKLMINNHGEVKRFSRHDTSAALAKGLHEIKIVFLGNIYGGWPSNWNNGSVNLRKSDATAFKAIKPAMLFH